MTHCDVHPNYILAPGLEFYLNVQMTLFLLVMLQFLMYVHGSDPNLAVFMNLTNEVGNKASETIQEVRRIMKNSRFHAFVGIQEKDLKYRLKHLCNYNDST